MPVAMFSCKNLHIKLKGVMENNKVKISVVMACYNSAAYLDEAVKSVLAQKYTDFELILVDDCSVDRTPEIIAAYCATDSRIVSLNLREHSGPAIARNTAIQAAKGEWIAILDSDDVACPDRLQEQVKLVGRVPGLVMVGSDSVSIDKRGNLLQAHRYPLRNINLVSRLYSMRAFPPHSSIMYRASAIKSIAGFRMRFVPAEDYDFWLRLSEVGQVGSVGKPLVKIRKHPDNISNWDSGVRQFKRALMAAVCHHLRASGAIDPSASENENEWEEFSAWVDEKIALTGVIERHKARAAARSKLLSSRYFLIGMLRFAESLLRSGHAIASVTDKFCGSPVPKLLAREWISRDDPRR